jgi:hypothetical protein
MKELRKQIRRAQWCLGLQRFVRALGWCWSFALLAALSLIVVGRYHPLGVGDYSWSAAAVGLGLLLAALWAFLTRRSAIDAAIEIDRRFGLKERVSSAVAMSEAERRSEVGQTVLRDAVHRIERIEVSERFPVSPGRQLLFPIVPAIALVVVAFFLNPQQNPAQARPDPAAVRRQIERSSEGLQVRLAEKREQAKKQGLKDAQNLFQKLEQELGDHGKIEGDKPEALAKLHNLAQQLEKRRQELGGADVVEKQLDQLKNLGEGPAEKFLQAVAKGDMGQAMKELEKIKRDLAGGKLSEQDRKNLARQMDAMKKKLENLAEAHKQARNDLERRIKQARDAGQKDEADKLQEQLRKLQDQLPQINALENLADKMGQCAKSLESGDTMQASKTLEQVQGDLQNLQQQLDEFEMVKEAMDQLDQARQQINCPEGEGEDKDGEPGMGMGKGKGRGPRPEQETPYNTYDTKASVKTGKGAGMVVGEVDGPNVKGEVQQKFLEQIESVKSQSADPLTEQRMSRKHREHAREYFDRFRENR